MADSDHRCPAEGCDIMVPMAQLACRAHWRALPAGLRYRINMAWRGGNTARHLAARAEAVRYWSEHAD